MNEWNVSREQVLSGFDAVLCILSRYKRCIQTHERDQRNSTYQAVDVQAHQVQVEGQQGWTNALWRGLHNELV